MGFLTAWQKEPPGRGGGDGGRGRTGDSSRQNACQDKETCGAGAAQVQGPF